MLDRAGGADLAAEMLGHTSSDITKKHYIEPSEAVNPVTAEILESLAPRRTDGEISSVGGRLRRSDAPLRRRRQDETLPKTAR